MRAASHRPRRHDGAVGDGQRRPGPACSAGHSATDSVTLIVTDKATGQPLANTAVVDAGRATRTSTVRRMPWASSSSAAQAVADVPGDAREVGAVTRPCASRGALTTTRWTCHPRRTKLKMEKGTPIGGIVRDESGQPIVGVTVYLIINKESPDRHGAADIQDVPVHFRRAGTMAARPSH